MADFVPRGSDQCSLEIARLDRPGALQQPPHRAGDAGADQGGEHETEYGGQHRQDDGDQHHLMLLAQRHIGVLAQQGQHIRSNAVQLLVEFVADFVNTLNFLGECLLVAAFERREQPLVLCVEAATGIVVDRVDTVFELSERRCVAESRTLGDQTLDQLARGQHFQLDLPVEGLVLVAERGVDTVFRRLKLRDDDPAYRKRPLQRTDIRSSQVAIGGHIAVRQLFDALTDLHHQYHGRNGGNGHQGDQRHRDPHDFSSDRQSYHGRGPLRTGGCANISEMRRQRYAPPRAQTLPSSRGLKGRSRLAAAFRSPASPRELYGSRDILLLTAPLLHRVGRFNPAVSPFI